MSSIDMKKLFDIALKAGEKILAVYEKEFKVETKSDDSPLTLADRISHEVIATCLQQEYPDIPILSEEGEETAYSTRKDWKRFWLIDPLDGTKEFIKRNGEFTVNISLIQEKYPVLGVVYAPALDSFYFGKEGTGAFKLSHASKMIINSERELIQKSSSLPVSRQKETITVVASRSHLSEETERFIEGLKDDQKKVDLISTGSSLKFCLVAEGKATYYPRFSPTMEWDTGAGQAIVEAAGGKVTNAENSTRFHYNRKNLKNGSFLAEK